MAFTSNCPKCQKQVLVPDGAHPDAVVQCPICAGEYSMGEILGSAPPALIVVHPGSTAVTAPQVEMTPAAEAALPAVESSEAPFFPAHCVEPTLQDVEPLLFVGDEMQLVTPAEPAVESMLFVSTPEAAEGTDHPVEVLAEPVGEPVAESQPEEVHDLAAEVDDGDAPWGSAWDGFKDEAAHEDGATSLAEPEQDEGLDHVDFADITGKVAPSSALAASPGDTAVAVEPAKKKKRKREANPLVRIIGMILVGLLALPCAVVIAWLAGVKMDFLPSWVPLISNKPITHANSTKPNGPAKTSPGTSAPRGPVDGKPRQQADAHGNSKPGSGKAFADNPTAGKGPNQNVAATNPSGPTSVPGNAMAANPPEAGQPGQSQRGTAPGETKAGPTSNKFATSEAGKGTDVAMNALGKESTKPTTPPIAKADDEPNPFGDGADTTPEVKPPLGPAVAAPAKPETPAKPDDDLFAAPPAVAPVKEKSKSDAKAEVKPPVEPAVATPAKLETPAKPDDDLFAAPPAVAPAKEKSKSDAKADLPVPAAPEIAGKPEKPEIGANPAKTADLKPDTFPVIGPQPKPDSEPKEAPGLKPEAIPDAKPAVKPVAGVGPLQAPSFPTSDLDASLKAISGVTAVDAKSYADWCKLAEIVTYVGQGADSQKQALRSLTERVLASPQTTSAIAASAKKLLDDKATKGGIVLAGTVTGVATKNGLSGTAIRMDGMSKPVMIFSAHPLDVKETQKVIVFGALIVDPAKNLPGYPGKQSVVVWADLATAIP
ncbi:MAG: hypothetical protein ACLP9L_25855 [Thermoguttaceae bacterium]